MEAAGSRGGETVVVLGATGNFGFPAVPLALTMGASGVVALGRNQTVLRELARLAMMQVWYTRCGLHKSRGVFVCGNR